MVAGEGLRRAMNDDPKQAWGERLAAESAAAGSDEPTLRRLLGDAVGVVKGRLGEVSKGGIRPLLDEAAAQVRPATLQELRDRYPGLPDDEVARRLIDRASKTAAGLALLVGGVVAAQQAMAVASSAAPPVAGTAIGSIGVTALAEVLALFVLEAKLRADLGALAGQPVLSPRELAANVLGDVQAAGGWRAGCGGPPGPPRSGGRRSPPPAAARRPAGTRPAGARRPATSPASFHHPNGELGPDLAATTARPAGLGGPDGRRGLCGRPGGGHPGADPLALGPGPLPQQLAAPAGADLEHGGQPARRRPDHGHPGRRGRQRRPVHAPRVPAADAGPRPRPLLAGRRHRVRPLGPDRAVPDGVPRGPPARRQRRADEHPRRRPRVPRLPPGRQGQERPPGRARRGLAAWRRRCSPWTGGWPSALPPPTSRTSSCACGGETPAERSCRCPTSAGATTGRCGCPARRPPRGRAATLRKPPPSGLASERASARRCSAWPRRGYGPAG